MSTKEPWNTKNLTNKNSNNDEELMTGNNFATYHSWTNVHQIDGRYNATHAYTHKEKYLFNSISIYLPADHPDRKRDIYRRTTAVSLFFNVSMIVN
jgi:hypothetical protein